MSLISDIIISIRNNLIKIENKYNRHFKLKEKRKIKDERIDIKLNQLLKKQGLSEQININAAGTYFESTKNCIKNCKYENVLKDMIMETNKEEELFVDFDGMYFEVLLEIMRECQNVSEEDCSIEYLNLCENYLINDNYDENKYTPLSRMFRVYEAKDEVHSTNLIENIKLFFYKDWETILQVIQIKGFIPPKIYSNKNIEIDSDRNNASIPFLVAHNYFEPNNIDFIDDSYECDS